MEGILSLQHAKCCCRGRYEVERQKDTCEGTGKEEKTGRDTHSLGKRQRGISGEGQHGYVWCGLCRCHTVKLLSRSPNPGNVSQLFYFLTSLWHLVLPVASIFRNVLLLALVNSSY